MYAYFLFSATILGFAIFESVYAFIGLFAFYGVVNAIIDANQRAYVSDMTPRDLKGTAFGVFHTVVGLASVVEGAILGIIWQYASPFAALVSGCIVTACAGTMMFTFRNRLA